MVMWFFIYFFIVFFLVNPLIEVDMIMKLKTLIDPSLDFENWKKKRNLNLVDLIDVLEVDK